MRVKMENSESETLFLVLLISTHRLATLDMHKRSSIIPLPIPEGLERKKSLYSVLNFRNQ